MPWWIVQYFEESLDSFERRWHKLGTPTFHFIQHDAVAILKISSNSDFEPCHEDIAGDQHFECRVPKANTVHPTFVKVEYGLHAILVQALFVFKVVWIIIEPLANAVHECFVLGNCPDDIAVEWVVLDIEVCIVLNFIQMPFQVLVVVHGFHKGPAFDV